MRRPAIGARPVSATPPTTWSVGVVIPAHDEADRIGASVASVRESLSASRCGPSRIVVVADQCSDSTVAAARRAVRPGDAVLDLALANVGSARRAGAARALRLLRARRSSPLRTWLLTTDADSTVPRTWVDSHLRLADAGAAAVAGIVHVDHFDEQADGLEPVFDRAYVTHADGTHPHVHGANLGIRADAYLAVGGWPALATAEDHAIWQELRRDGWPTVASIDAWVTTSGRRHGRAPAGFAGRLAELTDLADLTSLAELTDPSGSTDSSDPPAEGVAVPMSGSTGPSQSTVTGVLAPPRPDGRRRPPKPRARPRAETTAADDIGDRAGARRSAPPDHPGLVGTR